MRLQTAGVLHLSNLLLIGRKAHRIERESCGLVLHFERVLIHPYRDLFSGGQPIFPEEFPVFESNVAVFINLASELGRVQRALEKA